MSTSKSLRLLGMLALACAFTTSAAVAQSPPQSGWRMPNLIPSMGPSKPGERSMVSKVVDPFGLLPGNGAKASNASYGQPKQPSMLQKMGTGTKKMANQTADFLNPFNDGPAEVKEEKLTGSNSIFNQQANKRPTQQTTGSQSWKPGWFGSQSPTEQRPKTVNDFLSQPRMQP
jgi:hypothetical protein